MSSDSAAAGDGAASEELGLPTWLDDMLKPGVSSGVFTTLKLALVGLVCTLAFMLYAIEDARVRMHLSIFLGMACILLVLVIWFVGELAKSKAEAAADKSGGKGAANAPKPTPSKKSPKKPKKVD